MPAGATSRDRPKRSPTPSNLDTKDCAQSGIPDWKVHTMGPANSITSRGKRCSAGKCLEFRAVPELRSLLFERLRKEFGAEVHLLHDGASPGSHRSKQRAGESLDHFIVLASRSIRQSCRKLPPDSSAHHHAAAWVKSSIHLLASSLSRNNLLIIIQDYSGACGGFHTCERSPACRLYQVRTGSPWRDRLDPVCMACGAAFRLSVHNFGIQDKCAFDETDRVFRFV